MADKKPEPIRVPKPAPAETTSSKPSISSKLAGLFSAKPKDKKTKEKSSTPTPKKGQSSFLKNFNVKEVGQEGKAPAKPHVESKAKSSNFRPAKKEDGDWTNLVGTQPDSKPQSLPKSAASIELPNFKPPQSQPKQEPMAKRTDDTQTKPAPPKPSGKPLELPESRRSESTSPKPARKPVQLPDSGLTKSAKPKPTPKPTPKPKPLELPESGLPKPPAEQKAPSLLPGQKKGEVLGTSSSVESIVELKANDKSNNPTQAAKGLPSLAPKATAPRESQANAVKIPPPRPPVALKEKAAPKPFKPAKIDNLPSPSRKATSAGTLKKESVRLDKLPKPASKPVELVFSKPPIPLGTPKKASSTPPAPSTETKSTSSPKEAAVVPAVKPKADPKPAPSPKPKVEIKAAAPVAKSAKPVEVHKAVPPVKPAKTSKPAPAGVTTQPQAKKSHKKSPKVVLPPERESSGSNKLLILIPLIVLLLAGVAFFAYWIQRETSVEVTVNAGELTTRGDGLIVLNFAGKLEMLRNDYVRRRAPIEEEIGHIKANLSAAQGDLAGREQRKKLLQDALEQYQAEIPEFLSTSQQALDKLWNEESVALSKEYDDFKESLHVQIEDRAQELGADYVRNSEIDAIAVAVNAYRLALYGVARDVDVGAQRSWAEDLLQQWNAFEKNWREQQSGIKKKALEIKKDPVPKISETRKRIDNLEREIDALDTDLNSLKSEVARYEANLTEATARLEAIDGPFYEELRTIPDEFKVTSFPIDEAGKIVMPELQESTNLNSGVHFIMVTAVKGDQEFWAIQEFEVLPYQTVTVVIDPSRFNNLKAIFEKGIFMNP